MPTAPMGQINIIADENTRAMMRAQGLDPDEYAIINQPAPEFSLGVSNTRPAFVLVQLQIAIPYEALPLPTSGVLDAQGQLAAQNAAMKTFPFPPLVSLPVLREALSMEIRRQLADQEFKIDAASGTVDVLQGIGVGRLRLPPASGDQS